MRPDIQFSFVRRGLIVLIRIYAYAVSPLAAGKCRFYPTCSAYAQDALEQHGVCKGLVLTALRLSRCHPWHRGPMLDHVPGSIDWRDIIGYKRPHTVIDRPCGCACHHSRKDEHHAKP